MLRANDFAGCNTADTTYDTVFVQIGAPVGTKPDVGHDLSGNEVSGDTIFIDINEGLCYSFYVADNNPINPINYTFEFQRFNGTNINLGETDVVFRNDSIIGNVCFNSDCSNGGSLYRAIITGMDQSVCPPFASASDTVFIRVRTDFTSELGPDLSFCAGEGGTQLTATNNGVNGPYFYDWGCTDGVNCGFSDPFIGSPTVNPESSTTFYVQITDKDGCTSEIDSLSIYIQDLPLVNVGPDTGLCVGDPGIALSAEILNADEAGGGLTFAWSPVESLSDPTVANPVANPESSTIYTVVVTDSLGCSSDATNLDSKSSIYVGVSTPPIANAGDNQQICQGDTIQLLGIATEGSENYAYLWFSEGGLAGNPNSATPAVAPQTTTTYFLTAISDGCVGSTDSVTVNVAPRPLVDAIVDFEMCAYDSVQLSASISNYAEDEITYVWKKDGMNLSESKSAFWVQPDINSIYQVSAITNDGCQSVLRDIEVEVLPTPWVNVGGDQFICLGDSILLNGKLSWSGGNGTDYPDEASYEWDPNQFIVGTDATIMASPEETEVYTVTVSYENCETTDDIRIDVFEALDMELQSDSLFMCFGDTLDIQADVSRSSAFFSWEPQEWLAQPSPSNLLVSPKESMLYKARAELGGCVIEDSVFISVLTTPSADITVEPATICLGEAVIFESDPATGDNYIWNPGDGSEFLSGPEVTHIYNETGVFAVSLEVSNFNGCIANNTFSFVEVLPKGVAVFELISDSSAVLPEATFEFMNLSEEAASYSWDFGDGNTSDEANPSHTYREAGTYAVTLTVTDQGGCESEFVLSPLNVRPPTLFIPNVFSPNDDGLHDTFKVNYDGVEEISMMIVDRWGVSKYEDTNVSPGWDGTDENGDPAGEGVYYYVIKVGGKSYRGSLTLLR
ncbi:MAG: PKD domain-containing protein [Bacteroidota bacterium]